MFFVMLKVKNKKHHISQRFLMFLSLTLNKYMLAGKASLKPVSSRKYHFVAKIDNMKSISTFR